MAATGWTWTWTWQWCGRYEYRKVLLHTTNPDDVVPSTPSLTDIPPLQVAAPVSAGRWVHDEQVATMIDMNRLRELTAELGFMPATTDEADIDRQRQLNKDADYWLARSHRFDHLRREHDGRACVQVGSTWF